jgi:hypothetical protein
LSIPTKVAPDEYEDNLKKLYPIFIKTGMYTKNRTINTPGSIYRYGVCFFVFTIFTLLFKYRQVFRKRPA